MAKRTSVWRNSFKTFRQFGETIIMVLIANIRSDVIQILVRLYFISYATVTATFRITKMTTRSLHFSGSLATTSLARRHIRQGLSFALYDGSHASKYNCGNSCVFLTGSPDDTQRARKLASPLANRSTWPSLIRSLAERERGFRNSALLFTLRIANYSFVYSFNVRVTFKTNEGVCKETTEWPSTPQFSTCRAL